MNGSLDAGYYRLALKYACLRDLSMAAVYARRAVSLNAENEQARKLLGICLYELGDLDGAAAALKGISGLSSAVNAERIRAKETLGRVRALTARENWNKAKRSLRKLEHQSVRVLIIRGCIESAAKRYRAAAMLFGWALEKDAGNRMAAAYLAEAGRQRVLRG